MDRIREWFGEERIARDLERVRRFWAGEGRCIVSVTSSYAAYRQVFDHAAILERAPRNLEHQATLPGLNLPTFTADFGTVSTARYWGGTPRFDSTGGHIFIDPVAQTLEEALAIEPLPPDHPEGDAAIAVGLYRRMCELLETDALWLRTPDMQGVLNTAGLVVNQEELLMALHTEPGLAHRFLGKVADFLIAYAQYLRRETGNRVCGNLWPYTFLPCDLGVSFTEDLMPLLSPEVYAEFAIAYLRKLQGALGALHIHCCGDWGRHAPALKTAGLRIAAVEFHTPATRIEEIECLADETVFIPYILLNRQERFRTQIEYYRWLLAETPFRYWFALTDGDADALAFARELSG